MPETARVLSVSAVIQQSVPKWTDFLHREVLVEEHQNLEDVLCPKQRDLRAISNRNITSHFGERRYLKIRPICGWIFFIERLAEMHRNPSPLLEGDLCPKQREPYRRALLSNNPTQSGRIFYIERSLWKSTGIQVRELRTKNAKI
jgi:hypothetical protein